MNDACPHIFGERFKLYTDYKRSLCGEPRIKWQKSKGIRSVKYEMTDIYDDPADGITSKSYHFFLVVIMIIWFALIMTEMRTVWTLSVILYNFPEKDENEFYCEKEEKETIDIADVHLAKHIVITAMSMRYKCFQFFFNVFPRAIITSMLLWIGSKYLVRADNYEELILNSVAFGFLLEVSQMLGSAVASDVSAQIMRKTKTFGTMYYFTGVFAKMGHILRNIPLGPVRAVVVIGLAFAFTSFSYFREGGKYDLGKSLMCLCQVAGEDCMGAQILGGSATLFEWNLV